MLDRQPHRHREGVLLAQIASPASSCSLPSRSIADSLPFYFLDNKTGYLTATLMQHALLVDEKEWHDVAALLLDEADNDKLVRP